LLLSVVFAFAVIVVSISSEEGYEEKKTVFNPQMRYQKLPE